MGNDKPKRERMLLILDIDGTIGDLSHREHIIEGIEQPTEEQWKEFLSPVLVEQDVPLDVAAKHYKEAVSNFDKVIFLTSRSEYLRDTTRKWLHKYFDVDPTEDELFMRPDDDLRPSSAIKKESLEGPIHDLYGDTAWVLVDDEPDNLSVFDEFGLALSAEGFWRIFEMGLDQIATALNVLRRSYDENSDDTESGPSPISCTG